jgi:hypothetical protein
MEACGLQLHVGNSYEYYTGYTPGGPWLGVTVQYEKKWIWVAEVQAGKS